MSIAIPVKKLAEYCDPYLDTPWKTKVSKWDVARALFDNRLVDHPYSEDHAGRIAYLIKHPTTDAIEIDVGVPAVGCLVEWMIQDGNHR